MTEYINGRSVAVCEARGLPGSEKQLAQHECTAEMTIEELYANFERIRKRRGIINEKVRERKKKKASEMLS